MTLRDYLQRPFTPGGEPTPHGSPQDSQAGSAPRRNSGAGQARNGAFPDAGSEDSDLINALIGNPAKWTDLGEGVTRMKEEEARLDKIPFIAAYLDPAKASPEHGKANWNKLPIDHPMFPDLIITEHPDYYAFRTERRNSAPRENGSHRAWDGLNPPSPAPSLPADLSQVQPDGGGIRPLPADLGAAPPNVEAVDPRPGEPIREQAQPQRRDPSSTYKAYLAGLVGTGVGLAGGLIIAGAVDGPSPDAPGPT
jgi:hypothetical protein